MLLQDTQACGAVWHASLQQTGESRVDRPGVSLHQEMELLVQADIPISAILAISSRGSSIEHVVRNGQMLEPARLLVPTARRTIIIRVIEAPDLVQSE